MRPTTILRPPTVIALPPVETRILTMLARRPTIATTARSRLAAPAVVRFIIRAGRVVARHVRSLVVIVRRQVALAVSAPRPPPER